MWKSGEELMASEDIVSCCICDCLIRKNRPSECKTPNCLTNCQLLHHIHQLLHFKISSNDSMAVCINCETKLEDFVQFQTFVKETRTLRSKRLVNASMSAAVVLPLPTKMIVTANKLPENNIDSRKYDNVRPAPLTKRRQTMAPPMFHSQPESHVVVLPNPTKMIVAANKLPESNIDSRKSNNVRPAPLTKRRQTMAPPMFHSQPDSHGPKRLCHNSVDIQSAVEHNTSQNIRIIQVISNEQLSPSVEPSRQQNITMGQNRSAAPILKRRVIKAPAKLSL